MADSAENRSYEIKKNKDEVQLGTEGLVDFLEEILEASFDGIMVADGEGNCIYANSSYTKNTGIQYDQIVGHNLAELINPVWMKTSIVFKVLKEKRSVSMEHDTQNGNHIVVTGTPIFDDEGKIRRVVVNTRDISEINQLQSKLDEAEGMEKLYLKSMGIHKEVLNIDNETVVLNNRMRDIYEIAKRVSSYNTTVLITGESGTGKELVARYIHQQDTARKDKPFIVINCGAIPPNLLESELFGYTEGSFTGARKGGKKGLFEEANGGVIFLDEIGEMEPSLQVKLLRVLESKKIRRIGSYTEIPVDVRIIAATNRNLEKEVSDGNFRDDLYYRLNVVSLKIPPLRERVDEIVPLATKFINNFNALYGQKKKLTYDLIRQLEKYNWPGNIRELKNVIESLVVTTEDDYLYGRDLPWMEKATDEQRSRPNPTLREAVEDFERDFLKKAQERWHTTEAMAEALDVNQSTISRKLRKYGL